MPETEPRRYRTQKAAYTHGATTDRHPADDYPTPPGFLWPLLDRLNLDPSTKVWDPAAGGGHLVAALKQRFNLVRATDLYYSGHDFLDATQEDAEGVDWLITNPPFKLAEEFARHSFDLVPNTALLLNSGFLESAKRADGLFKDHPPSHVLLNSRKMKLPDGRTSVFAHVWLVWEEGTTRQPTFGWLRNQDDRVMPTGRAPGVWPTDLPNPTY